MLPLLQATNDHQLHRIRDLLAPLRSQFSLSDEESAQLLPSGTQPVFENRVNWAVTYMRKAGLIESPVRGHIRITAIGEQLLATNPAKITNQLLMQYPSFQEFRARSKSGARKAGAPALGEEATPEETLEGASQLLRDSLGQDLLVKVREASPAFFERLVVDLLVKMGYGGSVADAASVIGKSGDQGLDGAIKEDPLGLDVVYVQAKRWDSQVGRPIVQAFAGSLEGARARKGVLMTTSNFSPDALAYVRNIEKRIVLIDGPQLVDLMMDYGIGVAPAKTYTVQKIDIDYFDEG